MLFVIFVACLVALGHTASEPVAVKLEFKCFEDKIAYNTKDRLANLPQVPNFLACKQICKDNALCKSFTYAYGENAQVPGLCSLHKQAYHTATSNLTRTVQPGFSSGNMQCGGDKCTADFCKPCFKKMCEVGKCDEKLGKCTCMKDASLNKDGGSCSCKKGFLKKGDKCLPGRFCTSPACLENIAAKGKCDGKGHIFAGTLNSVAACASKCARQSSVFSYGNYNANKTLSGCVSPAGPCECWCNTDSTALGKCKKQVASEKYSLWTYKVPVDGKWGAWTQFGACSRTCGGGKKKRTRVCDKPAPSNGGRRCQGKRVEKAPCNVESCPVKFRLPRKQRVNCQPCPCRITFWAKAGRNAGRNETVTNPKICSLDKDGNTSKNCLDATATGLVKRKGRLAQYSYEFANPSSTNSGLYKVTAMQAGKSTVSNKNITVTIRGYEEKQIQPPVAPLPEKQVQPAPQVQPAIQSVAVPISEE